MGFLGVPLVKGVSGGGVFEGFTGVLMGVFEGSGAPGGKFA